MPTSLIVALPGSSSRSGETVCDDPVLLARTIRRYLTYTSDWDENSVIRSLAFMKPGQLDFNPRMFMYGGLAIYPVGGLIGAASAVGLLPRRPDAEHFLGHPESMARLYMAGRIWILGLVVLGIGLMHWSARQGHPAEVALLATLLYAMSTPVHAWLNLLKPHLPAAGLGFFAYGLCAQAISCSRRSRLWWAAAVCAMAASLVPTVGLTLIVPLVACFLFKEPAGEVSAAAPPSREPWRVRAVLLGQVLLVYAAVFVVMNPYFLLDFRGLRAEAGVHAGTYFGGPSLEVVVAMLRFQLLNAVPLPLVLLAICGIGARQTAPLLLTLALPAANLAWASLMFAGLADPVLVRFTLPSLPFICLLAAQGYRRLEGRLRLVGVPLLLWGVLRCLAMDLYYQTDRVTASGPASSELQAGRWIQANIVPPAPVGFSEDVVPRMLPPMDVARLRLRCVAPDPAPQTSLPDWYITSTEHRVPPGYELAARFLDQRWPVTIHTSFYKARDALDTDLHSHRIYLINHGMGHPLQLHQIPAYIYRRSGVAGGDRSTGRSGLTPLPVDRQIQDPAPRRVRVARPGASPGPSRAPSATSIRIPSSFFSLPSATSNLVPSFLSLPSATSNEAPPLPW
ncbi:MAG: hypothetical protein HY815_00235 [Candidatus Riflebacteria bacterium]|nr:hypothetical protein [Candidatus Riflebacteria bacterium]